MNLIYSIMHFSYRFLKKGLPGLRKLTRNSAENLINIAVDVLLQKDVILTKQYVNRKSLQMSVCLFFLFLLFKQKTIDIIRFIQKHIIVIYGCGYVSTASLKTLYCHFFSFSRMDILISWKMMGFRGGFGVQSYLTI